MRRLSLLVIALAALSPLSGCDLLGIETASALAARRDGEGRAIGAGCRNAGRAIEDCFQMNKKADKAAVFAGWRDMNDYMRDNKMEVVAPQVASAASAASDAKGAGTKKVAGKAAKSGDDGAADDAKSDS